MQRLKMMSEPAEDELSVINLKDEGKDGNILDEQVHVLAGLLRDNRTVRSLGLESNVYLSVHSLRAIGCMLEYNTHLQSLNLSYGSVADAGAISLAEVLMANHSLHELMIAGNGLTDVVAVPFAETLMHPRCRLKLLDLSNNSLSDDAIETLVPALVRNKGRTKVRLECNNLSRVGEERIRQLSVFLETTRMGTMGNEKTAFGGKGGFLADAEGKINAYLFDNELSQSLYWEGGMGGGMGGGMPASKGGYSGPLYGKHNPYPTLDTNGPIGAIDFKSGTRLERDKTLMMYMARSRRKGRASERIQRGEEEEEVNALRIQQFLLQQRAVEEVELMREAMRVVELDSQQRRAVTLLQARWRGYLYGRLVLACYSQGREAVRTLNDRARAALLVQRWWRMVLACLQDSKYFKTTPAADGGVCIISVADGRVVRKMSADGMITTTRREWYRQREADGVDRGEVRGGLDYGGGGGGRMDEHGVTTTAANDDGATAAATAADDGAAGNAAVNIAAADDDDDDDDTAPAAAPAFNVGLDIDFVKKGAKETVEDIKEEGPRSTTTVKLDGSETITTVNVDGSETITIDASEHERERKQKQKFELKMYDADPAAYDAHANILQAWWHHIYMVGRWRALWPMHRAMETEEQAKRAFEKAMERTWDWMLDACAQRLDPLVKEGGTKLCARPLTASDRYVQLATQAGARTIEIAWLNVTVPGALGDDILKGSLTVMLTDGRSSKPLFAQKLQLCTYQNETSATAGESNGAPNADRSELLDLSNVESGNLGNGQYNARGEEIMPRRMLLPVDAKARTIVMRYNPSGEDEEAGGKCCGPSRKKPSKKKDVYWCKWPLCAFELGTTDVGVFGLENSAYNEEKEGANPVQQVDVTLQIRERRALGPHYQVARSDLKLMVEPREDADLICTLIPNSVFEGLLGDDVAGWEQARCGDGRMGWYKESSGGAQLGQTKAQKKGAAVARLMRRTGGNLMQKQKKLRQRMSTRVGGGAARMSGINDASTVAELAAGLTIHCCSVTVCVGHVLFLDEGAAHDLSRTVPPRPTLTVPPTAGISRVDSTMSYASFDNSMSFDDSVTLPAGMISSSSSSTNQSFRSTQHPRRVKVALTIDDTMRSVERKSTVVPEAEAKRTVHERVGVYGEASPFASKDGVPQMADMLAFAADGADSILTISLCDAATKDFHDPVSDEKKTANPSKKGKKGKKGAAAVATDSVPDQDEDADWYGATVGGLSLPLRSLHEIDGDWVGGWFDLYDMRRTGLGNEATSNRVVAQVYLSLQQHQPPPVRYRVLPAVLEDRTASNARAGIAVWPRCEMVTHPMCSTIEDGISADGAAAAAAADADAAADVGTVGTEHISSSGVSSSKTFNEQPVAYLKEDYILTVTKFLGGDLGYGGVRAGKPCAEIRFDASEGVLVEGGQMKNWCDGGEEEEEDGDGRRNSSVGAVVDSSFMGYISVEHEHEQRFLIAFHDFDHRALVEYAAEHRQRLLLGADYEGCMQHKKAMKSLQIAEVMAELAKQKAEQRVLVARKVAHYQAETVQQRRQAAVAATIIVLWIRRILIRLRLQYAAKEVELFEIHNAAASTIIRCWRRAAVVMNWKRVGAAARNTEEEQKEGKQEAKAYLDGTGHQRKAAAAAATRIALWARACRACAVVERLRMAAGNIRQHQQQGRDARAIIMQSQVHAASSAAATLIQSKVRQQQTPKHEAGAGAITLAPAPGGRVDLALLKKASKEAVEGEDD
jgi:hypothetical protein